MNPFKFIGNLFVYRSPKHPIGFINGLKQLPSRKLRTLAGTRSHLSKVKLISKYLKESDIDYPLQ